MLNGYQIRDQFLINKTDLAYKYGCGNKDKYKISLLSVIGV